jgi:N-acylneuraminate cytidylyltransferase
MFFGHPLIAYTIAAAKESGIFDDILVSTNSYETLEICLKYKVDGIIRPDDISQDTSTDLEWINNAVSHFYIRPPLTKIMDGYDSFAILRPTSPFRSGELIRFAYREFMDSGCDSLRTMEMRDHPGKMWENEDKTKPNLVTPCLSSDELFEGIEFDLPTQTLHNDRPVLTQNGCLQIAKTILMPGSITGNKIYGYDMTGDLQGFDINTELDWILAEELVKRGLVTLPKI